MDITEYSYVVAGSGLLGAVTTERIANQLNQPVLVIEKRDHIGGNCYSAADTCIQPLTPPIHAE